MKSHDQTKYHLELYFYESCPFCRRVLTALKDLNIKVDYFDTMKNDEYSEKLFLDTGRETVPCLYINGVPKHESLDIVAWLYQHQDECEKLS